MAKYERGSLDAVFAALADPTRRAMTERLARGDACVSELAAPFDLSLPSVTKHLAVLEHATLVEHRKEGRVRWCRLVRGPLEDADAWIAHHRARTEVVLLHEDLAGPGPVDPYGAGWASGLRTLGAHLEGEP